MAKGMLQGSRIKGVTYWRDEVRADGGDRYLRHANRRAEEKQWRAEAGDELIEGYADYSHEPGRLYGCFACENSCHCGPGVAEGRETPCVYCADSKDA